MTLTLRYTREEGKWVGVCIELGTSTFGRNFERVAADLEALVEEHLNLLEEAGERERFFAENGIDRKQTGLGRDGLERLEKQYKK